MSLIQKIKLYSFATEPYAGGDEPYEQQIVASLPFLKLLHPKQKKILVIGCADGYELKWLFDNGFDPIGITKSQKEVQEVKRKYGLSAQHADIHDLPFNKNEFDSIYASNVLEHSVAPYVALREWRRVLKPGGKLVVVMPSKEWLKEYYHFSVLTRLQIKDLLYKSGFELLAGPGMKYKMPIGADIFYDLGRGRGYYDGYFAVKTKLPKNSFMLGQEWAKVEKKEKANFGVSAIKRLFKIPYNLTRVWWERNHPEIW